MFNEDIIIKPVLTEKSYDIMAEKRYVFEVAPKATKTQIKTAVEEIFDALEGGGLLYAKFSEGTQIGEFINEDAGFDIIEVMDDGVICKKRESGSINIFSMMC